ncbi:TPA: DoxX family protein [Burkholderia cenocepacia]|uniref:DoxX family protein n=1 Tax=Burkholderia cenocepacia TaxID=95486 RepID=UPI001B94C1BA|nr:DoxX family protein [Burkholderia cenocepacia]MBR8098266.1 DoxX family protein [Burkholderia cenocepacia]HEP6426284.1 DoxX family protein [Burkholderia cenocepacia]
MNNAQVVKGWPAILGTANCALHWLADIAGMAAPLFLRVALALPFFKSGLTKWDGFLSLSPAASFLFEDEFKLHILGHIYDLPAPDVLAFASGSAEIIFPILLILGLGTRLSALGLLGMTAVIQLIVPDGWANFHLPWATMAIALIAIGPGRLSLDHLIHLIANRASRHLPVQSPCSASISGQDTLP